MSDLARNSVEKIVKFEDQRASVGEFEGISPSIEKEIHEAQVAKWDTRRALAISSLNRKDVPLSFIRSMLQRGNFDQARAVIAEFKHELRSGEILSRCLVIFEEARLESYESNWSRAVKCATEALALGAPPATQLPLYQIRANAYFELGEFAKAARDIEEGEQLERVFPYAPSSLYLGTLHVKLIARDRGVPQAKNALHCLINKRIEVKKLDLDLLLTFLRVRIDLKRLSGETFWRESIACFLIADAIGDKLYAALAELDFIFSQTASLELLLNKTRSLSGAFLRISRICEELTGTSVCSTSIQTARAAMQFSKPCALKYSEWLTEGSFSEVLLVILDLGLVADLERGRILIRPPVSQALKALEVVGRADENGISKKEFFAAIWGRQVYSPRLHDTLISSLLHRLKRDCNIEIRVENHRLHADRKLLIV